MSIRTMNRGEIVIGQDLKDKIVNVKKIEQNLKH